MNEPVYKFNLIIVGSARAGKTSLLVRLVQNQFDSDCQSTFSVSSIVQSFFLQSSTATCKIFDMPGGPRYQELNTSYYNRKQGAVIVCDLADEKALESVPDYVDTIREKCGTEIPIILVGTKSDLGDKRKISQQALEQCAKDNNCIAAVEISSKDSTENEVLDIFKRLATAVIEKLKKESPKKTEGNIKAKSIPMHDETARQEYLKSSGGIAAARGYAEYFGKIWNDNSQYNTPKAKIIALLNDYMYPSSCSGFFKRLIKTRHHVEDVQAIIANSGNDSAQELTAKLKKIALYNTEGMLSHLIHYIENPTQFSAQNANNVENNARIHGVWSRFR